jgi:hypothetical protein
MDTVRKQRRSVMKFGIIGALCLFFPEFAIGQVINYENDPDLARALAHDLEMNHGDYVVAEREVAIEAYEKYLSRCADSFQRARIYYQMGVLCTTARNTKKDEAVDLARARVYFSKVLKEEPDRVGDATIRARTQLASLPRDREQRIEARMDVYDWLNSIRNIDLARVLLPSSPQVLDPTTAANDASTLRRYLEKVRSSITQNLLVDIAATEHPSEHFRKVIERFPRTELSEIAQERVGSESPQENVPDVHGLEGVHHAETIGPAIVDDSAGMHQVEGTEARVKDLAKSQSLPADSNVDLHGTFGRSKWAIAFSSIVAAVLLAIFMALLHKRRV